MKDRIIDKARQFYGLDLTLADIGFMKAQVDLKRLTCVKLYTFLNNRASTCAIRLRGRWVMVIAYHTGYIATVLESHRLRPYKSLLHERKLLLRARDLEAAPPQDRKSA
jgi:hypothetical protein